MSMAPRHAWLAIVVLSVLRIAPAGAGGSSVEVFTVSTLPVTNARDATVYHVDAIVLLEQRLSAELPSHPTHAQGVGAQRVAALGPRFQQAARDGAAGLARSVQLGIQRAPAIVFDGKWVVYGITDVDAARRIFAAKVPYGRR